MKIGIITFHHTTNYGATLQAFSLWKMLILEGHDVEIIDYRHPEATRYYREKIVNPSSLRGRKRIVLSAIRYIMPGLRKYFKMWDFLNRNTRLGQKVLSRKKLKEIFQNSPGYDAVIVGSDQVWCTKSIRGFDPSYFLDFIAEGSKCKKISYAASMGSEETFGEKANEVSRLLSSFDDIFVRDQNTSRVLKNECNVSSTQVLDPTFLLNFNSLALSKSIEKSPYLLLYIEKEISSAEKSLIKNIAKERGLKIISIGSPYQVADKNLIYLSPHEWLSYFSEASFIITSFYHGTIFSIKFRKQFYTLSRAGKLNKTGDLLHSLSLSSRIVIPGEEGFNEEESSQSINYDLIYKYLEKRIDDSKNYLLDSLSSVKSCSQVSK